MGEVANMEEKHLRPERKEFIIRVPIKVYEEIKRRCELKYIPMNTYILQAIIEKITQEKQFD